MEKSRRPAGRPSKPAEQRKRNNLTLRIRDELRAALASNAATNQRSLSEEAEARLERSFERQDLLSESLELAYGRRLAAMLMMLGDVMVNTGRDAAFGARYAGALWHDHPYPYDQAVRAAQEIMEAMRPEGEIVPPDYSMAARAWDWSPEKLHHHGLIQAQKPRSLAIELLRTVKGEPRKEWFQERAPQIRKLLGSETDRLRLPPATVEITEYENELAARGQDPERQP